MEKNRVLIVDDIAETREYIRRLIQIEADIEVVGTARTGREAVRLAEELKPDVILMDINMPDMDGISATELIRQRNSACQIVIVSIQGDPNYMRRAMLAGARDYLTKPPMAEELVSAIRRAGEMARLERAKALYLNPSNKIENHPELFLEVSQVEVAIFEEVNRLHLYQHDLLKGKLVDRIEALLTGVAHDLRSPLGIVMSILSTIPENPQYATQLGRLMRKAVYCRWLADNFLGISLSEKTSSSRFKIQAVIAEALQALKERLPNNIDVKIKVDQGLELEFDLRILQFVLMNLIVNSVESMSGQGVIEIFAVMREEFIDLFVTDSGQLILPEDENKLFELGFTTKVGSPGLGLFVSKRLLNQVKADLRYGKSKKIEKLFCISIPHQPQPEIETVQQLEASKKALDGLQAHIAEIRKRPLPKKKQKDLIEEFNRLTTTFTERLIRELLIFETLAVNFRIQVPDELAQFGRPVEKVEKNVAYCRFLASNLLQIAGNIGLRFEKVSLIDIIEEVLSLLERKLPATIYTVTFEIDPLLSEIDADAIQLIQVFMNLLKNAIDAMPNGGKLAIQLEQRQSGNTPLVIARITDTGGGISGKNLKNLFRLGFSTKPGGYGIGLYSVKNIIEKHHGQIEVQSRMFLGTTFIVSLPLHQLS